METALWNLGSALHNCAGALTLIAVAIVMGFIIHAIFTN